MTTTAKLASTKLTDAKGVPDDLARRIYDTGEGPTYIAVIELGYSSRLEGKDDRNVITLEVVHLEVAPTTEMAEALREIARSIYRGRTPKQLDLDSTLDDVEPGSDEYIRRAKALLLCPICVHELGDDRIVHAPDPERDGAFCSWLTSGTEVALEEVDPPDTLDGADNGIHAVPDPEPVTP